MPGVLTQKQENFVNDIFSGMYQRDAYIKNYNTSNCALAVIDANASRLANNEKVLARLAEKNAKIDSKLIASVEERREILSDIARGKAKNSVHAIDVHNKMDKIYSEPVVIGEVVQNFVFLLPDGTRVSPKQLKGLTEEE